MYAVGVNGSVAGFAALDIVQIPFNFNIIAIYFQNQASHTHFSVAR